MGSPVQQFAQTYADLWPAIQADLIGVIQADSFLGARPGVFIEPHDALAEIAKKVAMAVGVGRDGKLGVGFLVLPIEKATDDNPSLPGGPLNLTLLIQWVENVTVNNATNGTGIPIRVFAAACEKLLKLYTPVGLTQSLVPANPCISEFTPEDKGDGKRLRVGQVAFTAHEADFNVFNRVNRPNISVSNATATAQGDWVLGTGTTATVTAPDADIGEIYYTLDGSHPWQGGKTSQPYTVPVAITQTCLFRARAFAPSKNKLGSDTAAVNFHT